MAKIAYELFNGYKGNSRLRRWSIVILLVFLLAYLLAINSFTISQFRTNPSIIFANQENYIDVQDFDNVVRVPSGYLVSTQGCRIPDTDPFEQGVKRYFDKVKPIVCEFGKSLPLVDSNNTAIFVNNNAKIHYYNDTETIDCCWRPFWRKENSDNQVIFSQDCHIFNGVAFINEEFVRVECQHLNETIYHDYFAFVPRKLQVEASSRNVQKLRPNNTSPSSRPSILTIGIDSVSRLNFHRSMPHTLKALKSLGAIEMFGYNKVADNTYPNLVPVLTGLSEKEFEKKCWFNRKLPFDRCPFLWKNFSSQGYKTIFAEDACSMTTFNYIKPGFKKQPTDYYFRPFCIASENDIGNTHQLNANLCVGARLNFENLLHYTRKVADEFVDDPYFAFFWEASLTHDYIDYPQLGDEAYSMFLEYLAENKLLKNTALVFMSDHGMRWGSFRQTYQGRLEDSLPFLFVVMPETWRELYPVAYATLKRNSRSLTTPYDLHETLLDLLDPSRLNHFSFLQRNATDDRNALRRGISLFEPIPDYRTCEMAGIPEHWCMCHSSKNVTFDDPALVKATDFLVIELNNMLKPFPQCAKLKYSQMIDAKSWSHKNTKENAIMAPWTDYTITIETLPGKGVFEATVRFKRDDGNASLTGTIGRLNAYGKQSACVDDYNMRLYCYCY